MASSTTAEILHKTVADLCARERSNRPAELAALIAPLTLRDPGQPFTTVLPGL